MVAWLRDSLKNGILFYYSPSRRKAPSTYSRKSAGLEVVRLPKVVVQAADFLQKRKEKELDPHKVRLLVGVQSACVEMKNPGKTSQIPKKPFNKWPNIFKETPFNTSFVRFRGFPLVTGSFDHPTPPA